LERRPALGVARFQLALAYDRVGQHERALAVARELHAANPRFAPATLWLARESERRGATEEAISHYQDFLTHWHGEPAAGELVRARLRELESKSRTPDRR